MSGEALESESSFQAVRAATAGVSGTIVESLPGQQAPLVRNIDEYCGLDGTGVKERVNIDLGVGRCPVGKTQLSLERRYSRDR